MKRDSVKAKNGYKGPPVWVSFCLFEESKTVVMVAVKKDRDKALAACQDVGNVRYADKKEFMTGKRIDIVFNAANPSELPTVLAEHGILGALNNEVNRTVIHNIAKHIKTTYKE